MYSRIQGRRRGNHIKWQSWDVQIQNKVIAITGGANGIGQNCAAMQAR
jgi:hypothetical protein